MAFVEFDPKGGGITMRKLRLLSFLWVIFTASLVGQGRVSLSAPILKGEPDQISFTTRFSGFVSGSDYRLGVGTTGEDIEGIEVELTQGDTPLSKTRASFRQGFASAYFEVEEILVQGFLFPSSDLPGQGEEVAMKVTIPRTEADSLERIFIIVAKQFGPDRWYIMDGAEINDSHW